MGNLAVLPLRAVIAIALAGSLFVQAVMVPLLWVDLDDAPAAVRIPVIVIVLLGIVTLQVVGVCVWKLLTMVRRGTVFSSAAFRYVDIAIGAIATASVLTFGLAVVLAPGEAVPPGMVGLVCGESLVVAGVALLVFVLRMLLAQAVTVSAEARHLQSELDEVI
ncbi:MAG: DUF2975 domain-containing protein [Rhodococcus sp. (in: high G+C Gram-positive bacteria)]|uniref:DUF2975 domain-containing protein n=1 Tax=Rhodococcus sp. TaxID=1831 RepID=UPI003BB619BD